MTTNFAPILALLFLAITFIQSGYDKLFHWKENITWLTAHFSKSIFKTQVPMAVGTLLVFELLSGILSLIGCCQLFINGEHSFGFLGAVLSAVTFLMLFFGQRIAKDYAGAQTIAVYFVTAILAVYWLG